MRLLLTATSLVALATNPVSAQWLNHATPGIPRTPDGQPNLTAPPPHSADGKPDLTGVWRGPMPFGQPAVDPEDMQPWARQVIRNRADQFFKARPMYQCLPSGPATFGQTMSATVWKRILQTPSVIAILNDDLTYRQIFLDGRVLETAVPYPTWMGYSVGHWDGDALVVDSFGFNDKTWLNDRGLPHTEALRMTERYQRRDFGHLRIEVTFTDPSAYSKPLHLDVDMELAADTEMLEAVCETSSEHWIGTASDARGSGVMVAPDVLARYVGVYAGLWATRPRKVDVRLSDGTLVAFIDQEARPVPLVPRSETLFESSEGLGYRFIGDATGAATDLIEIHVSGDYRYARQR